MCCKLTIQFFFSVVSCHVGPYCLQLEEPPILLWKYLPTFSTMFSVPHNYEHRVPSGHEHRDATVLTNWRMKSFWVQISHLYGRDGQNSSVVTGHWPKKLVKWLNTSGCNLFPAAHDNSLLKADTFISLRIWLNCCLERNVLVRLHNATCIYV